MSACPCCNRASSSCTRTSRSSRSTIALNWPTGTASINALPWAEVFVDGAKVGETPLGNVSLPIGPHEITFRHPDLGEQKQGVTITLKSPSRISADLRKKP